MSELKLVQDEACELEQTITVPSKEELEDALVKYGYMGTVKSILLDAYFDGKYYLFSTVNEYVRFTYDSARWDNYILTDIKRMDDKKIWNDLIKLANINFYDTSTYNNINDAVGNTDVVESITVAMNLKISSITNFDKLCKSIEK